MDLEFSPSILNTPSLMTPNIGANPLIFKSSYTTNVNNDNNSISNIERDLKQSFTQPRKPTESPFQRIAEAGVLTIEKNVSIPSATDDIPSTAEVKMNHYL
jgi:hypothetical protein